MTVVRMDHVCIVVEDLPAAIAFFRELGLGLTGEATVEGPGVDRINGLEGVRSDIAFLRTPDGHSQIELARYRTPPGPRGDSTAPANTPGLRHIAFEVIGLDDVLERLRAHGAELVGSVEQYENIYRTCYIRGPAGVIVELAERIG